MTPRRLAEVEKSGVWQYQRFVSDLGEDRPTRRYPTVEAYQGAYAGGGMKQTAMEAYEDVRTGRVAPGSPQLDFHIDQLYSVMTNEKDIAGIIAERERAGGASARQRLRDRRTLKKRNEMLAAFDERDEA